MKNDKELNELEKVFNNLGKENLKKLCTTLDRRGIICLFDNGGGTNLEKAVNDLSNEELKKLFNYLKYHNALSHLVYMLKPEKVKTLFNSLHNRDLLTIFYSLTSEDIEENKLNKTLGNKELKRLINVTDGEEELEYLFSFLDIKTIKNLCK